MKQKLLYRLALIVCCMFLVAIPTYAKRDVKTFRIATARPGGTYFSMGALIAHVLSQSENSRPCEKGGSCGAAGLQAVALSSNGSVDNLHMLQAGAVEAIIAQADAAYFAYHGEGEFDDQTAFKDLRAIAYLWPESLHLISPFNKPVFSPQKDLKGKSIAVGLKGSGTLLNSVQVLDSAGLSQQDYTPYFSDLSSAITLLGEYKLDAAMFMGGWPVSSIEASRENKILEVNSLPNALIAQLETDFPWFFHQVIPRNIYNTNYNIHTVGVYSLLLVRADLPEKLVYDITEALWHKNNASIYQRGFQAQELMRLDLQKQDFIIPLHDGARRWYDEFLDTRLLKDNNQ